MRKIPVVLIGAEDQPGMLLSGPFGFPEARSDDGQVYGPGEVTILLLEPAENPDDHDLVERAVWLGFEIQPAGVVQ